MGRKCNSFFQWHKDNYYSLTFDDVSVRTAYSKVKPSEVDLSTKITKNVTAKNPLLSAAMDTVTDYRLAIAIAKQGGMGFIHKNMTPEMQAWNVVRVKSQLNGLTGLIEKPVCAKPTDTLNDINQKREEKKFPFHTFLVVDDNGKLAGMITKKHFLFTEDYSTKVGEIMDTDVLTAPADTDMDKAFEILKKNKVKVLPLIDGEEKIVGLYAYTDLLAVRKGETTGYNVDSKGRLRVGAAISDGTSEENLDRLRLIMRKEPDVILVDSAHGDTDNMVDIIRHINKEYPGVDVMAGNISEPASAKRLIKEVEIHGLKVGQGPGSICSTRKVAGIGCPQLSAIYEIVEMAQKKDIPVCADGGVKYSGDIVKAIAAGAHTVMLGSLLAGTKESPGDEEWVDGKLCKVYRGMGSEGAMKESAESRKRYRQENVKAPVPEGVEGVVPYKGTIAQQVHMLTGGIKNGFGYAGAPDVETLRQTGDFRRVTPAGAAESMPHSVHITKRPPNL